MAYNVVKQLIGTAPGQAVDDKVDAVGASIGSGLLKLGEDLSESAIGNILTSAGYPATPAGAIEYADSKIDTAIESSTVLTTAEKADLKTVIDGLATLVEKTV